jgi:SNF2 family DNA or RNA helicase
MKLYPFQREGVQYLVGNRRAYLADEMGLGKTPQAIVAARQVQPERISVICPAIAEPMWRRRWAEWEGPGVPYVTSYAKLVSRPSRADIVADSDLLILDEAHYVKSIDSKRTRIALTLANRAERVWLLSGTPMPNHPGELYAPLRAVWPDLLRERDINSYADLLRRYTYCRPTPHGIKVFGLRPGTDLRELVQRVIFRRLLKDVALDLPPLRWEPYPMEVTYAERDAIAEAVDAGDPDSWGNMQVFGELPAESPHMATTRRLIGEAKAHGAGITISRELTDKAYDKIVVLAYHRSVLDTLQRILEQHGLVRVDGSTPQKERETRRERFQTDPHCRVFLGQITAVGTAIDLHAAHEIALVEQLWSPEDNRQAVKRVHRIGQKHPVRARMFTVPDTIDDAVTRVIARKLKMIGETVHI